MTADRASWWWYQARVLETMRHCLTLPYEGFVFTQYDSICLRELPHIRPEDSVHRIAGGACAPFKSSFFLHPPWCFGKARLEQFVAAAKHYNITTTETGIMDRWLALIIEERCMPFTACEWSWTANSIDTPEFVACVRQAIANGCRFVHGVKDRGQLWAILV